MRGINLNMTQTHPSLKLAISLIIIVLLLGSACTLISPPPEPPPPEPENQPPVIHSIIAEREVTASTECPVSCRATDADGDALDYWWSADGGMIEGVGDSVTWIAPDIAGDYTVTVMVTDGNGGEAIDSVTITVTSKPNQPPVIVGLTRDGNPAKEEEKLRIWRDTTIECIAEDPDGDELSFIWLATSGTVKGKGNKVEWIAPGVAGDCTVTVRVTDSRGGEAEASMQFDVLCCGH